MKNLIFTSLILSISSSLFASSEHSNRKLTYGDDLIPLFEQNCIKCHGGPDLRRKGRIMKKGGLDLTKIDSVKETIEAGKPKDSLLYSLTVTDDEDEIMPPKGRHLSTSEAQLIYKWIEQGADFANFVYVPKEQSRYAILVDKAKPAPEELLSELRKAGSIITRVSDQGSLLRINFEKNQSYDDKMIKLLKLASPHISDLDLSFYPKEDLSFLSEYKNLTHLNLRHSQVNNHSLIALENLPNLEQINLYSTKVSETTSLAKIPALKSATLSSTKLSQEKVNQLKEQKPKLKIEFLDLETLVSEIQSK